MRILARRTGEGQPVATGLVGSVLVHGAAVAALLLVSRGAGPARLMPTYRVELVAAPAPSGEAESKAEASPAPAPAPVPPPPAAPSKSETAPVRRPAPSPPAAPPAAPSRSPNPPVAPSPGPTAAPGVTPGTGSDPATVRTEGVEFPFPGYLRNLVAQVYRRWRPPSGNTNLEAEVLFMVHRDGSISGLQFVRRSGSFTFDLEAQGAVEAAARAQVFGPLPPGYGPDMLPVSFFFSPRALR